MREYNQEFYENQVGGSADSASVVAPIVLDLLPGVRSCVDVGCGTGVWAQQFHLSGVPDVMGIDGAYVDPGQLRIARERFIARDLTQPIRLDRKFDLCVCLEVGEHLPNARAASFVADLTALAPVVLFSAAIPGQGGLNHINEQWPDYWQQLFAANGYRVADCIRHRIWDDRRVDYWYRQNILLFADDAHYPALASAASVPGPLSIVHPVLLRSRPLPTRGALAKEFFEMNKLSLQAGIRRISRRFLRPKTA